MNDRERLIELIDQAVEGSEFMYPADVDAPCVADHLLANGVIVPPCKAGDIVYLVCRNQETYEWYICEKEVYSINVYDHSIHIFVSPICGFAEMEIGVRLFLTKEEAERALKEREKV